MRNFALTYPQLINQAIALEKEESYCVRLRSAYELAVRSFDGFYRAQGIPFICHLTRTASIILAEGQPVETAMTALLHSAYMFGNVTPSRKKELLREVGGEVETLVRGYGKLSWREPEALENHLSCLSSYSDSTRQLLCIRLANELEDHLDFNMVYRGSFPYREWIEGRGKLIVELARRIGSPALVKELEQEFEATLACRLPESVQRSCRDAYELPEHVLFRKGPLRRRLSKLKHLILNRKGPSPQ